MDSDESLRWRVCPALEFCTACVEDVCSFFFFVFLSLQGMQGIGFYGGAGWSPGHSALFAWGMKTVFTGRGNSFGLWCAPRGPLFLQE